MWDKISSFIIRFRIPVALFLTVFTVFMAWMATKTEMSYELQKVIPDSDPDNIVYEKFKKTFGEDGSVMVIGVRNEQLFDLDFFQAWYRFTEQIDSVENVEKLISITRLYELIKNDSLNRFQVLPLFNRMPQTQEELDSIRHRMERLPFYENYLFNEETMATFVAVTMDSLGVNSHRRVEIVEEIEALGAALSEKHQVELHYSGVPYIRTENTRKLSGELALFTFLSILITAIFLLIFFRSLQIVVVSLVIVALTLIFTIGSMYLLGYKIGILTALIPPLMVVISIQNCIYLLNIYHFEYRTHGIKMLALKRSIAKVGLASLLTNATTAIGFGVFSFTGSNLLDEFGRLAALNIMLGYVVCITLVPIIYTYLPGPTTRQLKHLDRRTLAGILGFVSRIIVERRKWVYGVTIAVVLICAFGATRVRTFGYILDGISPRAKLYQDLKFFESNFNGLFPFEIWIDTKAPGNVKELATLTKIEKFTKELKPYDELSKPIAVTQMLKFMNQAYYDGDPRRFRLPNPLDMGRILSYMPGDLNGNNPNSTIIRSMIDSNYQVTRVSMMISDVGTTRNEQITAEIEAKIDSIFPPEDYEVHVTGKSVIHVKGNAYLIKNALTSLVLAFVIISLLMALLFTSYRMILIALLPNLIPLAMTLGIMGFAGISLKESTILIFSVAFGMVVDLTIHYLAKYRLELKKYNWNIGKAVKASVEHSGFSMIYSTVILVFGFIIFAFSSFEGTKFLGILVSISLFLGLLSNLFLLPSLLLGMEKRMNARKSMEKSIIELEEDSDL